MTLTKHALAIAISFAMGTTAYAAQDQSQHQMEMESGMGQQQPGAQTEAGQERQGMMTAQPAPDQPLMYKSVNDIIGMNVKNQNNEDIGTVENVVVDPDTNELYAVVSAGGVLGIGDKQVPMELKELELRDESLISRTQLTEDELKNRPEYVAANYQDLEGDRVLGHVAAAGPAGESSEQFAQLDTDGDGVISQQEAEQSDILQGNWQAADVNSDQQIDRVEFAAFEGGGKAGKAGKEGYKQFSEIDKDGDGVISQQEAENYAALKENWQTVDMDNDQQINRAEFSAFEERQKEHGEYKQPGQTDQQDQQ